MMDKIQITLFVIAVVMLFKSTPTLESFDTVQQLRQAMDADCQEERYIQKGYSCVFDNKTDLWKLKGFKLSNLSQGTVYSISVFGLHRMVIVIVLMPGQVFHYYFTGLNK